jgi:alcohol dehydrogenase class IV
MRDELYYASLYAGMALNITGTCFPHTMGYVLTENFGVPHGFACAAFLPAFVKRALEFKNTMATQFLSELGVSVFEFENILNSLNDLGNISMTKEQIESCTSAWQNVKNFANTPGSFDKNDAAALLEDMFLRQD